MVRRLRIVAETVLGRKFELISTRVEQCSLTRQPCGYTVEWLSPFIQYFPLFAAKIFNFETPYK